MECERIQDLLSDYLDGSLPESGRIEVYAHLRDCRVCAETADGLENTILLLKNLPPVPAPPELLERIRRETARKAPEKTLWKRLFLPAHVKIPLEAAAAILVFMLVYVMQKRELPSFSPPPPAVRTESAVPAAKEAPDRKAKQDREKPSPVVTRKAQKPDSGGRIAEAGNRGERSGQSSAATRRSGLPGGSDKVGPASAAPTAAAAPSPQTFRPTVPAQRVSTSAGRIEPDAKQEEAPGKEIPFLRFAAPPSRLLRPVPYGREVMLEVEAGELSGLEERIVEAALRHGGGPVGEPDGGNAGMRAKTDLPEAVRVRLPLESAGTFISELRKFGTVPPEAAPAWADIPAGHPPGTVVYTVRIRVR